jgi:hypothetical protein
LGLVALAVSKSEKPKLKTLAKTNNNLVLPDCRFLCGLEYPRGGLNLIHGDEMVFPHLLPFAFNAIRDYQNIFE